MYNNNQTDIIFKIICFLNETFARRLVMEKHILPLEGFLAVEAFGYE